MPRLLQLFFFFLSALIFTTLTISAAQAQVETNFRIMAVAQDAKYIGTAVGGAQIVITDRRTGDILVQGITTGSTAGSEALLAKSRARDAVTASDQSADFEFSLDLFEPLPVTITASAPLAAHQNAVSASKDMLLLPGKDYTDGNAITVEIPGFIVDIATPPLHSKAAMKDSAIVPVAVNVLKLCGCHVSENSPWTPERYEVEAHIYRGDYYMTSIPMEYSGKPGIYRYNLKFSSPGTYRINITAYDPQTKEAGMDTTTITLTGDTE